MPALNNIQFGDRKIIKILNAMNNKFLAILAVAALFAVSSCADDDSVQKTLSFEGSYWTNLIDNPQYGGKLLYGDPYEVTSEWGNYTSYLGNAYSWYDSDNTKLSSQTVDSYGSQVYWNGGDAISHYVSGNIAEGSSDTQLTVYKKGASTSNAKGGYKDSDNFCVHTGTCTAFSFKDNVARKIIGMYVTNTLYTINVLTNGNYYCPAISSGEYFKIIATGYDALGNKTGSTSFTLANGPSNIVSEWTWWDLSSLGLVAKVDIEFDANGNLTGSYGLNAPAYFAYDDVKVEFEL